MQSATTAVEIRDVASGLWIWRAQHPQWKPGEDWQPLVTSTYVESGGERLVIDALSPRTVADELWKRLDNRPPTVAAITIPDHSRDLDDFVQRYQVRAYGPNYFSPYDDIPKTPLKIIEPDKVLPGGIVALYDGRGRMETPLWLPEQRVIVFGDALTERGGELRVWYSPWHEKQRYRRCESCYSFHSRESLFHIATVTRCRAEQHMSTHSNSPLTSTSRPRKLSPQTRSHAAVPGSDRDEGSDTKRGRQSSARFQVKELGKETWPDFERMVEKHNGVWGGCWCTFFHLAPSEHKQWSGKHKEYKEKLVRANRSHAALVYDGPDVVGWCQFGPLVELPGRMRGYGDMDVSPPDWRTTCFFVDRDHRREGVARAALEGALRMIDAKGGGTVDGYPIALPKGKKYSSSFIWGGTESMYLSQGFHPLGPFGTSNRVMVMRKVVRAR